MDPMLQSQLRDWLMIISSWAMLGAVLYIVATAIRRKQRITMQQHVLDKFSTAKDFAEFVQSEAGQKYVMSFADTATSSSASILNSVRLGVVLVFAAFGLAHVNPAGPRIGAL